MVGWNGEGLAALDSDLQVSAQTASLQFEDCDVHEPLDLTPVAETSSTLPDVVVFGVVADIFDVAAHDQMIQECRQAQYQMQSNLRQKTA